MKRIDRLILGELSGPWLFGVAIFTVLIMAGTYLFKLTDFIVSGISFATVAQFTMLLLPGVAVKTFSMAVLLATLLAFGRLSSDSEVVALRAAGASIWRIMAPVGIFSFLIAAVAFAINETVVPTAAYKGTALSKEIEKRLTGGGEPIFRPIYENAKLRAMFMAQDFNLQERSLENVVMVTFNDSGQITFIMTADGMRFQDEQNWRIQGNVTVRSFGGEYFVNLTEAWPEQIGARPPEPEDIAASDVRDLDSFSMAQMEERIKIARSNPSFDPRQIANLEYGYYNKIALPLAALIFGLVGAPLGIRNHRTGAAVGFWLSVIIIFGYMMLANFMALWAQGGVIPAWAASFTPLAIGLIFAAILMRTRNA